MNGAREVQFEVQRQCPINGGTPVPADLYPFAVWVRWPELTYTAANCGGRSYAVLPRSVEEQARRGIYWIDMPNASPAVCEHMGRIIE